MKPKYPHLCSPITIGNVTFRNRMFAAPVGGTDITADCSVGPRTPAFYEMKAKGGAASVTASELVVHPATDASHMFHLCIGAIQILPSVYPRTISHINIFQISTLYYRF